MKTFIVIEERAGEHSYLQPPTGAKVPYCRCGNHSFVDAEVCGKCGRYIRGLFRATAVRHDSFKDWEALMREAA